MGLLRAPVRPEEKVHQRWIDHNDRQAVAGLRFLDGLASRAGDGGWLAGTGLEGWQQVQYVPVQFRVLQSDGSFSPARRTTWGYVFARKQDESA